ncbi:hypothetical protein ACFWNN_15365 [Lentzea sp. NPDC058450]|uniref:hypothetical protein n=1 Tax=Lentzea sp. NPDC058450 TaxID=3346505 RepID=UPI003666824B
MDLRPYLEMTDDELYATLGASLLGSGAGMSPEDRDEAEDYGRTWFKARYAALQQQVCLHPKVKGLTGGSGSDRVVDAATIAELVQEAGGNPLHAAVIAVLVTRIGLGLFCANVRPR